MPILTDTDKTKTIAQYLGITGTEEETRKKMEETEAVRDLLNPLFDFKADELFHNRKPYPFVVEKLAGMTLGDIERDKGTLLPLMKEFYTQMLSDFNEEYGDAKQKPFLKATGYDSRRDGDEKEYFFKFWRSPLSKVLAYRGIDTTTEDGKKEATKILEKLFGPDTSKHPLETLIQRWPETLVEDKEELAREYEARKRTEEIDKALLKTKPLYETLTKLDDIHFSSNDPIVMAQEAFLQPDAHKRLKEYLGTKEELDEKAFLDHIDHTPQQLELLRETIKNDPGQILTLTGRNDAKYLADHPEATFAQLIGRPGRPDIPFGEDAKYRFLEASLGVTLGISEPLDKTAINEAMDKPCTELKANADKIVTGVQKRAKRNKILIMGSIILGTTAAALGLVKIANSISDASNSQPAPAPAPVVQQANQKQTAVKPADQTQKSGLSGTLSTVSNTVATATAQATASTNDTPTQAKKPSMPEKGNRLLSLQWAGYKERGCYTIEENAQQWLFGGEFDHMFNEIRTKGLPFTDLYDRAYMSRTLSKLDNVVNVGGAPGHEPHKFYIKRDGGRTGRAVVQDMLNWYDNMNDVLESLPVAKENLIQAQLKTMDAIGPSLGWSVKQQLGWQITHPDFTKHARENIAELTAAGIKERKVDTNNVEAVFMEAINAASIYRQGNPQAQGLFLIAEEVTRKVAGIEMENTAKFDQVQKPKTFAVTGPATRSDQMTPAAQRPQERVVVKKEGYSLWWVAAGVALGMYLMSVRAKRKNQIVK